MKGKSIWDNFLVWLAGLIARWTFKVLSGVFLAFGITSDKWQEYVYAIVSFLIGALLTYIQNKYLKQLDPNKV